jgi:hypothetical protein
MSDACSRNCPELRATVRDQAGLVMTPWSPGSASPGGPAASQLSLGRLAGVFDLTIERTSADDITIATDLLVTDAFVAPHADHAYERLIAWASGLGYRRVWCGHELVALEPQLLGGVWSSTCRHCGLTWSDSTPGFWLAARGPGYFPLFCSLCSHSLPQPTTVRPVGGSAVPFHIARRHPPRSEVPLVSAENRVIAMGKMYQQGRTPAEVDARSRSSRQRVGQTFHTHGIPPLAKGETAALVGRRTTRQIAERRAEIERRLKPSCFFHFHSDRALPAVWRFND